jgi:hypothetical protein
MTNRQLEKAKAQLKAYVDSKKSFKCEKCEKIIKIAPPFRGSTSAAATKCHVSSFYEFSIF